MSADLSPSGRRGRYGEGRPRRSAGEIEPWSPDTERLVRAMVSRGAHLSEVEFRIFAEVCQGLALNPLTGQIYVIRREDGALAILVGIDGYRAIAARTGAFAGEDGPYWKAKGGPWMDSWDSDDPPHACKVEVLRREPDGTRSKFRGIVHWANFVRRSSRTGNPIGNWRTMPAHMLAVRAETHALRKAFPEAMQAAAPVESEIAVINPDSPITTDQLGRLHMMARALGWETEERHARAGVESFTDLTKGEASALIDAWGEDVEAARTLAEAGISAGPMIAPQESNLTPAEKEEPEAVEDSRAEEWRAGPDPAQETEPASGSPDHVHTFEEVPNRPWERCTACGFTHRAAPEAEPPMA